jgi:hypothetical protein
MLCSISKLDDSQLEQITLLEKDLGRNLLSFTCHDVAVAEVEDLELEKIQELEAKLGVALVAVK